MMGSNRWRELHGFKTESRGGTGAFTTPLAVQGEGGRTEGLARASGTAGGKKATEGRTQSGSNERHICAGRSINQAPLSVWSVPDTPRGARGRDRDLRETEAGSQQLRTLNDLRGMC